MKSRSKSGAGKSFYYYVEVKRDLRPWHEYARLLDRRLALEKALLTFNEFKGQCSVRVATYEVNPDYPVGSKDPQICTVLLNLSKYANPSSDPEK